MQADQLKSGIERAESCADEAKRALQQSQSVPQELRQSVETLHQQLSQAKKQPQMGEDSLRNVVLQAEQASDRAVEACRNAGGTVNTQLQQAVQRTHQELSSLKKEIQQQ